MIRGSVAAVGRTRGARAVVGALERLLPADPHRLTVLTYHRIGDPGDDPDLYPGLLSANASAFAEQMAYVASHRRALTADELVAVRNGAAPLPARSVVVTFDDAYVDFEERALPVLERFGVPALLFVPTAYPDRPAVGFWWDRLWAALRKVRRPVAIEVAGRTVTIDGRDDLQPAFRALVAELKQLSDADARQHLQAIHERLPEPGSCHAVLGWDAIRRLPSRNVGVAAHTRTHPRLDRVDHSTLATEIEGSRRDLERSLGEPSLPLFAYPDGGHTDHVVRAVRDSGISIAFTTQRGANDTRRIDWLRVRRINVGSQTSLALIQAQLLLPGRLPKRSRPRTAA